MTSPVTVRSLRVEATLGAKGWKSGGDVIVDTNTKVSASTKRTEEQFKKTTEQTKRTGDEFKKTGARIKASARDFDEVSRNIGVVGLSLAGAFALVVSKAAAFEKQMSEVGAVSNATGEDLDALSRAALKAGKDTAFSATQAAQAEAELAKAGVSTSDILGGALTGSLSLAAAGQLELADAATIAAQAMNIFKLRGDQVGHIADVLAAGANKSAADVEQLGLALRQGGLVAAQTGLTLEDTVGVLSAFADNALVGSDAGTSLKSALQQLQAPSIKSADLMKKYGITLYDARGQFVGITKLADELQQGLGDLTQAERDAALAQIFGSDATRAAAILYKQGAAGIQDYVDAVNDQGAAADVAAKKMDNLAGDIERLTGSVETLAIESGSGANQGLRILVQFLDHLIETFSKIPGPIQSALVILTGITGIALLAAAAFLRLRKLIHDTNEALLRMGPAGARASTALQTTTRWALRAGGALAALEIATTIGHLLADSAVDVDTLSRSLQELAKSGELAGKAQELLGKNLDKFAKDVRTARNANPGKDHSGGQRGLQKEEDIEDFLFVGTADSFDFTATATLKRIQAIDAALAQLAQSGHGDEASKVFDQLAKKAQESGVSTEYLLTLLPQYAKEQLKAADATSFSAIATDRVVKSVSTMAGTLEDAIAKAGGFQAALEQLSGAAEGLARKSIDAEAAIDTLSESLKENGKTLDIDTAAGRKNLSATLDVIDAAREAAQAKLDESGSVAEAKKTYDGYIKDLHDALIAAGLTEKQVQDLIRTYADYPKTLKVDVETKAITDAQKHADELEQQLFDLEDPHHIGQIDTRALDIAIIKADQLQNRLDNLSGSGGIGRASSRRWGGITHAAAGSLRQAEYLTPARDGRMYVAAEEETLGEAFVPRNGDYQRSMRILDQAARWYGARVAPAGGTAAADGGGSGGGTQFTIYTSQFTTGQYLQLQAVADSRSRARRRR